MKKLISKCHGADVKVIYDEHYSMMALLGYEASATHYKCLKCHELCDIKEINKKK